MSVNPYESPKAVDEPEVVPVRSNVRFRALVATLIAIPTVPCVFLATCFGCGWGVLVCGAVFAAITRAQDRLLDWVAFATAAVV